MGGAATTLPLLKPHSHPPHTLRNRRSGAGSNSLSVGSVVEVRPEHDEDFVDTYFSATVISPVSIYPKKGKRAQKSERIGVEYHNLFEGEDGSKRLKEQVSLRCVRPSPEFQEVVENFHPGDAVDAFYREGWWIGVVARAAEGGERKYAVTFQHPPEVLDFGLSELRVHWDWADGNWVRPHRQSIAGLMFDVGRKVEVSFDQENRQGAWFPGTIHQQLGNGTYMVGCPGANSDNTTVTEIVDSLHLRPWPPLFKYKNFVLLEKVDAFFEFGWWSGVIKKEFENSRYLVFFKQLNMEKTLNQSQLRPHMEWKDGKWFTSSQDISTPSSEGGVNEHLVCENPSGSVPTAPVNDSGDGNDAYGEKTPDQVDDSPEFQTTPHLTSRTKRRNQLSDSRIARAHARQKLNEGNVLGANQQEMHGISLKEIINGSGGNINSLSVAKNSIGQTSQVENPEHDAEGNQPDVVDYIAEEVQTADSKTRSEIPLIIGLPCAEMVSSGFGMSRRKKRHSINSNVIENIGSAEKQQLDDSTTKKIVVLDNDDESDIDIKKSEVVNVSGTRKRGRPRKTPVKIIEIPATDDLNEKDDNPRIIPEVEAIVMETLLVPDQGKTPLNKDKQINSQDDTKDQKRTSTRKRGEKVVEDSTNPEENHVPKRGRRRSTILQVQDLIGASGGKSVDANSVLEVNIVCEEPSHEFDNQPLSKWIEGLGNPSAVDVPKPTPVCAVEQPMENREENHIDIAVVDKVSEKHQASEVSSPAMVDKHLVVSVEPQYLPFVKNTLLWKTIEAMEVFQKIPQNPHFQPLEDIKESLREGKAIGYMVTFASVVVKISELQFGDPKSVTDDIIETLAELERYGFNVRPIQDRVAELLEVKEKEMNLVGDLNELNDRILERHQEKDKIEEEIDGIKEEIRKLEQKLSVAESAKEKEEDELAVMGDRLKETEESIVNVRHEFEGIVSCPF